MWGSFIEMIIKSETLISLLPCSCLLTFLIHNHLLSRTTYPYDLVHQTIFTTSPSPLLRANDVHRGFHVFGSSQKLATPSV